VLTYLMVSLLAQTNSQTNGAAPSGISPGGGYFSSLLPGVVLFILVFYFMIFRGDRKRRRETEDMIGALKKNDRVVTIGGIIGTVVTTKEDEIVVKVDEANNTKMTFSRKAIQRVITRESEQKG